MAPVPSFALPQGGQVVEGSAQINQTTDTRLDVIQSTDKAIIDWRSFSIGANETTAFQQPSAQSITLNRVTGSSASVILGNLVANGQIMLVNNNGILIGSGAQIDVAGLVATTADISNRNFMAGNYVFDTPGNIDASVVNYGNISVDDQGLAALVAPGVANYGVIQARLGQVALASGNTFTLDFYGDRKIQLAVDDKVVGKAVTADGTQLDSLVENTGTISAEGGKVLLTANAAKDIVDNVINMEGVIQARTAEMQGGEIVLSGGDAGTVRVAGTLDATGAGDGETGGSITVTGEQVALAATADLDASGDAGGGTVHVGGEYRGGGTTPTAQATSVAAGASLKADATGDGDGGEVVVWADDTTDFKGAASARGGAEGGDGGLIEVSGQTLTLGGTVDVGAVAGTAGRILFDPADLIVDSAAATTFVSALSSGGTIDVEASNSITVDAAIDSSDQSSTATLNFKDENGDSDLTVNLNATIVLGVNQDLTGEATTVNVTDGADIQNGIDVSAAGGTVNVAAGDYYPGDVYFDSRYSDGVTNNQILIDKELTLNGAAGAIVHVALPDQDSDLKVDKRTVGFTIAADNVTIDGFTIQGPLDGQTYDYRDVDFADLGYSYGIFVAEGAKGSQITNNIIYDLRTGVDYGGDNGASSTRDSVASGNDISNTRGAFLLRSTGVEISGNSFGDDNPDGITHNEWDLAILGSDLAEGDIFTSPFVSEDQYGADMMALSEANNDMTILDRRFGQDGEIVRYYNNVSQGNDPDKAAQAAAFANRSHVTVLAGANNDTGAGLGETRGNGFGSERLPIATITDGIDAVVNGGTVTVLGGTYVESSQIVIDKDLTVTGLSGDKAIITPGTDFTGTNAADAWFLVEEDVEFYIGNVVFDGTGYSVWQAVRSHGMTTVDNVDFRKIQGSDDGSPYRGFAISSFGGTVVGGVGSDSHGSGGSASTLIVRDSTFTDIGRIGVLVKGDGATAEITGNTYTGKGTGDFLDYAVEVGAGGTATIKGNTITDNLGVASSDGSTSAGILVTTAYGSGTSAVIEDNVITGNSYAVAVGYGASDTSVVTASSNDLSGNDNGVDFSSATATADFSGNWWGSTDDATVAAYMAGDAADSVDFSTYLASGTDTDGATAGFQGDFANLMVTTLGGQTGTTGRVQEGVDRVDAGGTVTLSDGTYSLASTLTVTTGGITLTGESEDGVILDASAVATYGVSIRELDGITLSNFTLRDAGTYGLKLYKLTDLTLQDVTVEGSGRSEVDLLGIDGATLTNVTADGQDTAGVGISLVDSHNVAMSGITTTGNQWGGIGIMTAGNNNVTGGSSNISLTGTNSLAEDYGIYTETDYNSTAGQYYAITNLTLEGYEYTVQNSTFRDATVGDSTEHTIYKQTEAEAIDLALALGTPDDSVVRKNSGSTYASIVAGTSAADGSFIVGTSGSSAMSIQAAVDAASDDDTIEVRSGTYSQTLEIAKNVSVVGAGVGDTIIQADSLLATGVGHKYTSDMQVTVYVHDADDVTLSGLTIDGNNLANGDAVVFWTNASGTISDAKIENARAFSGAQTGQGLAVDATGSNTTTLTVSNVAFENWNKNAIDVVNGNGASSNGGNVALTVENSTFTGRGDTDTIAQNAIVLWERAGGTISASVDGSTFSDLGYTGSQDADASGILIYGSANGTLAVSNSSFSNIDLSINVAAGSANDVDATVGNTFDGVAVASATEDELFAIVDGLYDGLDDSSNGLIRLVDGMVYVTAAKGSIQNGVDVAATGDTVRVQDGTYGAFATSFGGTEDLIIQAAGTGAIIDASGGVPSNGRIVDLRADGTTFDGFTVVGADAGVGVSVSGQGVTVSNNTIYDTLTGVQTTTQYTAGNATISGNTITADYGISLQNTDNTVSGNTITAVAEGLAVKSGVNTATGNTVTVSGGEALALYDGAVASDLTLSSNTVTVAEGATLQNAVDLAGASGSLTIGAGTYTGDIVISQANLTVIGAGSDQTIIQGVGTGESAAVKISADDVTLGGSGTEEGFQIVGAGKRAVYLDEGVSGATIQNNTVVAAENQVALESTGSQSGHTIQGNTFTAAGSGTTRQLVYINGAASLGSARASSDVDFLNNTFTGDAQLALGNEATGSRIEGNTFSGDNSYATVELWGATESFTGNTFGTANGTHLVRSANANTGTVTYEAQADVVANNTFTNVALVRDAATEISSGSVGIYGKIQSAVDAASVNDTVDVVDGTFEEQVTLSTEGLTLAGSDDSKIVVDGSTGLVDAVTITADNVTVQDLTIEGIADESYVTYAWSETNRGIVVRKGVEDFTIKDNTIANIRNGILIDGIDSTGSVTGNVIDNTKSAISVQYTDASGVTISGNSEGTYGNEWGVNLHLNGYWDGTSYNSNPIATVASADWQTALLALSTTNGGWSVQDQGYEQANRTHVQVATTGSASNQGSLRTPISSLQAGVDGLVDGGYLTVSAGTYSETVTVSRDVNLTTDGTIVLNGLTVDGDLTLRTDVAFDSSAVNGNLAFNGDVLGLTDEGQDLTLDAGDGDVTIKNVGTSTIGLGDVTVTAGNYYGSAGTSYVASMDITGDGNVEVGTSTVNASGSVNLSGGNVSGSVNAATATVTASTGTANVNVTATQTASVSGKNVQGSVSAATATVTATQTANVTVTATSNASVSGQNVTANVTAPTASVTATQTANVTANVNNLTASAGSGSVNNTGGTTTVSGNGVLAVNGKNETPGGENPNDESLNAGGTITVTFNSGPKSPAQVAFGGGSVQQPFSTSYSLGIGAGGGSGLAVAGEGGEGPEADTSGPDETLGFAGSFLGDFWNYYFTPEGGEGDSTDEESNNGV